MNGVVGYGESGALVDSFYNEEYQLGCWDMMRRYWAPMLLKAEIERPEDVHQTFLRVRRNFMAKSTVEAALWDAYPKCLANPCGRSWVVRTVLLKWVSLLGFKLIWMLDQGRGRVLKRRLWPN